MLVGPDVGRMFRGIFRPPRTKTQGHDLFKMAILHKSLVPFFSPPGASRGQRTKGRTTRAVNMLRAHACFASSANNNQKYPKRRQGGSAGNLAETSASSPLLRLGCCLGCCLGCALPIIFERKSLSQYPRTPNGLSSAVILVHSVCKPYGTFTLRTSLRRNPPDYHLLLLLLLIPTSDCDTPTSDNPLLREGSEPR